MSPRFRRTSLSVEHLDERVVPTVNLTTRGLELPVGTAIVTQTDPLTAEDGDVNPFLRVRDCGVERGFNTDARPVQFDERTDPAVTHSLTLGEVPLVTKGGVEYREFLLDIRQVWWSPRLSVDQVRVFLGDTGNLTMTRQEVWGGGQTLRGRAPVFQLADTVILTSRLNRGRDGTGDMFLYVPASAFAGATDGTFVYLFSKMGGRVTARANGGAETWSVVDRDNDPPPPPPPPPTGSLAGTVYHDTNFNGNLDGSDIGLAGETVELLRFNDDLQDYEFVAATTTGPDGSYSFGDLVLGTYSIREVQPGGQFVTGSNDIGTLGGTFSDTDFGVDQVVGIDVGGDLGLHGTGYNFAEIIVEG